MMSHLDEGRLQELIDGEIPSTELPPIQAHLNGCAECRARLEAAREFASEADRLIDAIELTENTPPRVVPLRPVVRPSSWRRNLAWAATLVIAVGAGYVGRGSLTMPAPRQEAATSIPVPEATPPAANGSAVDSRAVTQAQEPQALADRTERERANDRPAPSTPALRSSGRIASQAPAPAPVTPPAAEGFARKAAAPPPATALAAAAPRDSGAPAPDSGLKKARKPLGSTPLRLEETVVAAVEDSRAKSAVPFTANQLDANRRAEQKVRVDEMHVAPSARAAGAGKSLDAISELTLTDAIRRLGGNILLIHGMIPIRLEGLGDEVRVVYPVSGGELVVAQKVVDGRVTFRFIAPPGFPADSLDKLRARVRE